MTELTEAIRRLRGSVGSLMKVSPTGQRDANGQPAFNVAMVGTAWCVAQGRFFVSAFHVLNGGQPRVPADRFFLFMVPDNGPQAFHFPVTRFVLEEPQHDYSVLEIDPGAIPLAKALPVTFGRVDDGVAVATCGFPAPEIHVGQLDPLGNWMGGQFFLKSHANSGIVSASYDVTDGVTLYELNVGWHHGESGGPICRVEAPFAAFSIMQHYRNVQSPHGIVAGPHRGVGLGVIESTLRELGAEVV